MPIFETSDDVPDPRDLNSTKRNLMIVDDLQLEKQNKCEAYFIRGRHSNVDCFYLAQNYFKLPRQVIRENSNFICLFPQDLKNMNHIYNDHVSTDMLKEEFKKKLCKTAWDQPHGFVGIDLTSKKIMVSTNFLFSWEHAANSLSRTPSTLSINK